MPPRKPWRDSAAKEQLIKDLKDGTIPLLARDMSARVAYDSRTVYQEHDYDQFRDRLNVLRKKIHEKGIRSAEDKEAFDHDCGNHPKATHDHRGVPRWEGSEAEKQLRKDVKDGKDTTCTPKELWEMSNEYQKYPLFVFRGHIYQERRRKKFLTWLESEESEED
jgi:hypothetical protein